MAKRTSELTKLAIAIGDDPPVEFRIFKPGWNDTENGRLLFDDAAAKSVMAAYAKHGVDRMIDLEHLSLDDEAPHYDPDARGWCRLELRGGELWAVGVTWTSDGSTRLSEKRQRYISPAVGVDTETRRVQSLLNIAITSLPATHDTPALVAARAGKRTRAVRLAATGEYAVATTPSEGLTTQQIDALAQALGLGTDASVEDVISALGATVKRLTDAASGGGGEPDADDEPMNPAGDPAELGGAPPPGQAPGAAPDPKAKKQEMAAARTRLLRLTGKTTPSEALDEVAVWRASYLALSVERKKLADEQAALDGAERKKLVVSLVALGAETPHTSGLATGKLVKRLDDEPIAELRERVTQLSAAGGAGGKTPRAPAGGGVGAHGLTDRELAICKETGCDPQTFATLKQRRSAVQA